MGVLINVNWRVGIRGTTTVGWPLTPSCYVQVADMALELRKAGFSAVLFAPFTKGSAGQDSAGYDLYDPYDIGSKVQPYDYARTAFGTADELRAAIATLHAEGLGVYGDMVLHQYLGGDAKGNYTPIGADGKSRIGRFPKTDSCFVGAPPRVGVDDVPDQNGNFAFGDMASYQHSEPAGYMHDGAVAAALWIQRATGIDGWRIDDAKGTYAPVIFDLLHEAELLQTYAFGEYFDGAPGPVANWVRGYMRDRCGVMDFATKFNIGNICNNNSRVWMGQLSNIGYCIQDAAHAVTFIESADSDTSAGQQTVWNKILGYAVMLTFPGYPMVYYKDWQIAADCYGLKRAINNLVWIHENLAQGEFVVRLDDEEQVFVHERLGFGSAPGCLCAFNNDQFNAYTRTVQTSFGPHAQVHEYTGNGSYDDIWTDDQGRLTFTVPRNNNGASYLVFAHPHQAPAFAPPAMSTTQVFQGALDLDIMPLPGDGTLLIGAVTCATGSRLSIEFTPAETQWGNLVTLRLSVLDPAGEEIAWLDFDDQGEATQLLSATIAAGGPHRLQAVTTGMPPDGTDFALLVDYMGVTG